MSLEWRCKFFTSLCSEEVYALFQLRQQVFILEQQCLYDDIDAYDKQAWHFGVWRHQALLACLRILPPGVHGEMLKIGRLAVVESERGQGLAGQLLEKSFVFCQESYPDHPIKISAQSHLESYYQIYGFQTCSEPYDDEGILHIDMIKAPGEGPSAPKLQ